VGSSLEFPNAGRQKLVAIVLETRTHYGSYAIHVLKISA